MSLGKSAAVSNDWKSFPGGLHFLRMNLLVALKGGSWTSWNGSVESAASASMDIRNLHTVPAFQTKDGSEIRELLAHRNSVIRQQSLAEARVPSGGSTLEHTHATAL
jgi:hypothetical protein